MTAPPLTHHEIIALVAPFARRGRHVDLAGSDRPARRIVFKPVEYPAPAAGLPALREVLVLDCPAGGTFRLTRSLVTPDGLQAVLTAGGSDPGELLARIDAVAAAMQFERAEGLLVARSYRLEEGTTPDRLTFTHGETRVDGLRLTLRVGPVRGAPGEIELVTDPGDSIALPEDFLSVQGLAWARLRRTRQGWAGSVRLRGSGSQRGRDGAARLGQAARHVARSLAEPPARFHERRVWMRWALFALGMVPILSTIGVISGLIYLQYASWAPDSLSVALMLVVPPLLFFVYYALRDVPGVDKPPLPRRSRAMHWRSDGGAG